MTLKMTGKPHERGGEMKVEHRINQGAGQFPGGHFVITAETDKDRELLGLFAWLSDPMANVLHGDWVPCIHGQSADARGTSSISLGMRKKG